MLNILKILFTGSWHRLKTNVNNLLSGTKPPLTAAGLTILCPIKNGGELQQSYAMMTRKYLQDMPLDDASPMAKVPNTYLCRFYVLNDVFYEGAPAVEEHLKSQYIVFSTNYYGDLDEYLSKMWEHAEDSIKEIWQHCVAFDQVNSSSEFVLYIKKCKVKNYLFFNGSTGAPLSNQLKSLYLKQEFSRFVYENQGKKTEDLQRAFHAFVARTEPTNIESPTWVAGAPKETIKTQG